MDVDTSAYGDVWVAQKGSVNGGHRVSLPSTPDEDFYRSDGSIGAKEAGLKGNQVYNLTGGGQKVTVFSEDRKKVAVFARGGNDGEYADDFRILGTENNRDFKVKYYATSSGERNITADVKVGGFIEWAVLWAESRLPSRGETQGLHQGEGEEVQSVVRTRFAAGHSRAPW